MLNSIMVLDIGNVKILLWHKVLKPYLPKPLRYFIVQYLWGSCLSKMVQIEIQIPDVFQLGTEGGVL